MYILIICHILNLVSSSEMLHQTELSVIFSPHERFSDDLFELLIHSHKIKGLWLHQKWTSLGCGQILADLWYGGGGGGGESEWEFSHSFRNHVDTNNPSHPKLGLYDINPSSNFRIGHFHLCRKTFYWSSCTFHKATR